MWDFGSAAKHHQLHCPWMGERSRAGISMLRGAMSPEMGRAEDVARKIKIELEMRGLHKQPLGIDVVEPPVLFALQKEGITVVDGQQLMSAARVIKTEDEISLLNHSAMMVDARLRRTLSRHEARHERKPGRRAREQSPLRPRLRIRGSHQRHLGRALQSASARLFRSRAAPRRSGLLRHPAFLHGLPHLLLPVASRSASARMRWWMPTSAAAIISMRPSHWCGPADRRERSPQSGPKRRSSASRMKKPPSACNTDTASASPSGKSP